jgi:hypothetical protein
MSQLSQLRQDKIGSLFQESNEACVAGECLSPAFTWQQRASFDEIDRGPFSDESAYLNALISTYISHAEILPMTPHAFFAPVPYPSEYSSWASYKAAVDRWNDFVVVGQKIDHSKNRLAYCITGQLMREMLPHLSSSSPGAGFPLSHPDLHTGNIFVDQEFNVIASLTGLPPLQSHRQSCLRLPDCRARYFRPICRSP